MPSTAPLWGIAGMAIIAYGFAAGVVWKLAGDELRQRGMRGTRFGRVWLIGVAILIAETIAIFYAAR